MKAVAYYRTSSASNVGADKDSLPRQREAVERYAQLCGLEIVDEFYDEAVSGADSLEARPGFSALLDRLEANGVRIVVVEDASRFARDLLTQELGIAALIQRGVRAFSANGDELTATDDPMRIAMRQVAGAFAQLEKARLVAKLRHGRDAKRAATGRCEGRKPVPPETIALAKRLAHPRGRAGKRSLREIAADLAEQGHVAPSGRPYGAESVRRMLVPRR